MASSRIESIGRRGFLKGAMIGGAGVLALGAVGDVLVGTAASADPLPSAQASTAQTGAEPPFGGGVFDVDPDQSGVSQDPNVAVTGIDALPEDWSF